MISSIYRRNIIMAFIQHLVDVNLNTCVETETMSELRIPYRELVATFEEILLHYGFSSERASLSATLFAKASLDGVASHGLNRFPFYLENIRDGYIDVDGVPERVGAFGSFERWDGNLGPGNLNAHHSMARTISLAKEHGIGCVALRNTNHWMRAGNYGWQAVEEGCIGLCFTNTIPNMPAWGGSEPRLGNNPVVIAIPREDGPVVIDMALAQFSYGKMYSHLMKDLQLPHEGGFDQEGNLTKDPETVIEHELALPIGLWKGAGLSLMLDIIASVLSEGNATHQIGEFEEEHSISQLFLCFYPPELGLAADFDKKVDSIIENLKSSPTFKGEEVRYPGEATLIRRRKNRKQGVPVDKDMWERVISYKP